MSAPTKTQGIAVLAHQAVVQPASAYGSAQDVSTKIAATIICFHAPIEAVANTVPGIWQIQGSGSSTGNEDWADIYTFSADSGTPGTEALTATEALGETVLAVASTTLFAANDVVYIKDTTTLADSEWGQIQEIATDASITLVDGLTTGKDSADFIWGNAERTVVQLDVMALGRVRVIFTHEGASGADVHVKALMITADTIG